MLEIHPSIPLAAISILPPNHSAGQLAESPPIFLKHKSLLLHFGEGGKVLRLQKPVLPFSCGGMGERGF